MGLSSDMGLRIWDLGYKEIKMEKSNKNSLVDIALVLGICYLAANGYDGWGWLILILALRNG
jgi:hypothetical protein